MKLSVRRFIEIEQLPVARTVERQPSRMLPSPRLAFPTQNLGALFRGLPSASLTVQNGRVLAPPIALNLYSIDDGIFFVGHQLDGTILTADGAPVHQTAAFRGLKEAGLALETALDLPEVQMLDEVFVGFDGAWRNYFHWMCFGLTKSFLAARHLAPGVTIAVPDYQDGLRTGAISYSEATWAQSLEFSGLSGRVKALPSGAYRCRKLHFFWTSPREPTDIMVLDGFKAVFDAMIAQVRPPPMEADSIYLARGHGVTNRIADTPAGILARALQQTGFRTMSFEGTDLRHQISVLATSRRVVSPHGAGLTNMLFHPGGLRVLELNKALDGGGAFRPWFFVTSAIRNHPYATLDSDMPNFSQAHVHSAIAALDG